MLHAFQFAPFPDAGRQRQYEAMRAALAAAPGLPTTLLLGHVPALGGPPADALLLHPEGLVVLVLTPGAGHLTMPALGTGAWLLDGQPLPAHQSAANPFAQYSSQLPRLQAWVAEQLGCAPDELPPGWGLAVFEAPLTFGPEVELHLHQGATDDFELLGGPERVPARLRASAATTPVLTEAELLAWAARLHSPAAPDPPALTAGEDTPAAYLLHKARQLWHWLSAADVPPDPPYGSSTAPDGQEQARLQAFRQELQAELRQHRQEAAAREAAYQQEVLRLQQQVLQAGVVASTQQAQAADDARQAARAELEGRTQELNYRIQQLGQLITQLQATPPAAVPVAPPATAAKPRRPLGGAPATRSAAAGQPTAARSAAPAKRPVLGWRQLRPTERWVLLSVALAGAGLGTWKAMHPPKPAPTQPLVATHRRHAVPPGEAALVSPVYVADSSPASTSAADPDTAAAEAATDAPPEPAAEFQPPPQQQTLDTQRVRSELLAPLADTTE